MSTVPVNMPVFMQLKPQKYRPDGFDCERPVSVISDATSQTVSHAANSDVDSKEVFRNLFQLFLVRGGKDQDLFSEVFKYAVNGKKSNEDIARELNLNPEESALIKNLEFGLEGKGLVKNKTTGEIYINPSRIGLAIFTNIGKVRWGEILGVFIKFIKASRSSDSQPKDVDPKSESVAKEILATNAGYFEAVFNSVLEQTQGKGIFTSLANKIIGALSRGAAKALTSAPMPAAIQANNSNKLPERTTQPLNDMVA